MQIITKNEASIRIRHLLTFRVEFPSVRGTLPRRNLANAVLGLIRYGNGVVGEVHVAVGLRPLANAA